MQKVAQEKEIEGNSDFSVTYDSYLEIVISIVGRNLRHQIPLATVYRKVHLEPRVSSRHPLIG